MTLYTSYNQFLKPKIKMLRYEKILSSLKIKIGGRKKFRKTHNPKSDQKQ